MAKLFAKNFLEKIRKWQEELKEVDSFTASEKQALTLFRSEIFTLSKAREEKNSHLDFTLGEVNELLVKARNAHAAFGGSDTDILPIDADVPRPFTGDQFLRSVEATAELLKKGKKVFPEIMVPVTVIVHELSHQKIIVDRVYKEVCEKTGLKKIPYLYGTMIETPRAALRAEFMAKVADFFSFGTNDLTQMTSGFSRDDSEHYLPYYIQKGIYPQNPLSGARLGRRRQTYRKTSD